MQMRNERMTREILGYAASNVDLANVKMRLSGTLYEQISGVGPMELARNPNLLDEELFSRMRRLAVLQPLLERLARELESF